MSTASLLTVAGVAMIVSGIAIALVIGPEISRRAARTGGKTAPLALWRGLGAFDALAGVVIIAVANAG